MTGLLRLVTWRAGLRFAVVLAVVSVLAGALSVRARADALPSACSLLTQTQASTLAGTPVNPPDDSGGTYCQFTAPTTGPEAQVEITIGTDTPRTLLVDRKLGHQFTKVSGVGDEAYEEDWNIFVRKGSVWVGITLVRLDDPAPYAVPLQTAAAEAITQVPSSVTPTQNPPPQVVGAIPKGKQTNPIWSSPKQRQYGGDLKQLPGSVVYQSDVVVIPGGASAIRGVSSDGLTWTLAGSAAGVSKLHVGKIMAATTLAIGRVLALKTVGATVQVTLGPVDLPDVFEKADFDGNDVPLTHPLFYDNPQTSGSQAGSGSWTASGGRSGSGSGPGPVSSTARTFTKSVVGGTITTHPICCSGFTGVALNYDNPAGRMTGVVELEIPKPTVDFELRIDHGSLQHASLRLNGSAGLDYQIDAATKNISGNFNSGDQVVPVTISIPLGAGLEMTFTQSFVASLQLSGAAAFKSRAEYKLTGDLGFSYDKNGGTKADSAVFATKKSILEHTNSIGLGTNSLSLAYKLRATVGIGLASFTAGGYFALQPTVVVAEDASPGSPTQGCVTAAVHIDGEWGAGWTIPDFARKAINALLGVFNAKPIPSFGGKKLGSKTLWNPKQGSECPAGKTPPPTGGGSALRGLA
jgi:hypothetical protein